LPYPKIIIFFLKIHDFQLLIWKKYFFLKEFAPNYAEFLIFTIIGAPTLQLQGPLIESILRGGGQIL